MKLSRQKLVMFFTPVFLFIMGIYYWSGAVIVFTVGCFPGWEYLGTANEKIAGTCQTMFDYPPAAPFAVEAIICLALFSVTMIWLAIYYDKKEEVTLSENLSAPR